MTSNSGFFVDVSSLSSFTGPSTAICMASDSIRLEALIRFPTDADFQRTVHCSDLDGQNIYVKKSHNGRGRLSLNCETILKSVDQESNSLIKLVSISTSRQTRTRIILSSAIGTKARITQEQIHTPKSECMAFKLKV